MTIRDVQHMEVKQYGNTDKVIAKAQCTTMKTDRRGRPYQFRKSELFDSESEARDWLASFAL